MEIYLIRHTRVNVPKDIFYGQTDVPLEFTFEIESDEVEKKLQNIKPDITFSSPLTRCKLLAEKVAPKDSINFDNRLLELDFGDWEMKSWKDLKGFDVDNWYKDFVNVGCPNGESYLQLRDRLNNFIEEIKKQNHKKVFIFTHAGVIRAALSIFDKIKLEETFRDKIDYGSIHQFTI